MGETRAAASAVGGVSWRASRSLKGRRIRRRRIFSDYALFSVDERQKIGAPEDGEAPPMGHH